MHSLPTPLLPDVTDMPAELLADWVEAYTVVKGRVTRGDVSRVLDREGEHQAEDLLGAAWLELRARSQAYGDLWPLRLSGDSIQLSNTEGSAALFHYFLCILSLESGLNLECRDLFELCVAEVFPGLGIPVSLHVGFPRHKGWPTGVLSFKRMPASLDQCLRIYTRISGEKYQQEPPPQKNDLKIDIVGWRPMPRRGGWVHYLGQCTAGKRWRTNGKLYDVDLRRLRRYVHWCIDPIRFFAIPYSATSMSSQYWLEACEAGGLVLDRLRLLELHQKSPLSKETAELVRLNSSAVY